MNKRLLKELRKEHTDENYITYLLGIIEYLEMQLYNMSYENSRLIRRLSKEQFDKYMEEEVTKDEEF